MRREDEAALEPIVAHGSRMTWAGILRRGDEFPPAKRSELAVITASSGPPLRRYFGRWSGDYRRFTTNLTSAKIAVRVLQPGERPGDGLLCVVHWVSRGDMLRTDEGGVCHGDGWPVEFWSAFVSQLDSLPPKTVAEKLRSFADSRLQGRNKSVAEWRARLEEGRVIPPGEWPSVIGESLIPTPVELTAGDDRRYCIVSWAPSGQIYRSLSEALASPEAIQKGPDLANQAKYYLECTLARLHGVRFGPNDWIEDPAYERTREVLKLATSFRRSETQRIAKLGSLDRFGPSPER